MIPLIIKPARKRLWTPERLTNCALWLDARDSSTVQLNGNTVAAWLDKSGNGRNAAQSTAANQPPYNASDSRAKNQPGIGASSNSGFVGLVTPSFTATTWIMVMNYGNGIQNTFNSFETVLSGTGTAGAIRVMGNSNAPGNIWFGGANEFSGNSFVNGSAIAFQTALPMPLSIQRFEGEVTTQTWGIGFNQITSGRTWNGVICEAIALSSTSPLATIQLIEGYLAHKWNLSGNLPNNHPFKFRPPVI